MIIGSASTPRFNHRVASHTGLLGGSLLVLALTWLALTPASARASISLAADLEADVPVDQRGLSTAPGVAGRLGWQLHLPLITITPEIGFHYTGYRDGDVEVYRGIAGARLGIGELFRFGAYAHAGFGQVSYEYERVSVDSSNGFTFDGGLFLDVTAIPLIELGVHIGYGRLEGSDGVDVLHWLAFGVHAALVI